MKRKLKRPVRLLIVIWVFAAAGCRTPKTADLPTTSTLITTAVDSINATTPTADASPSEYALPAATESFGNVETGQPVNGSTLAITPSLAPAPKESLPAATGEDRWAVYHSDPQHLWNRLFRQFFRRTTNEGEEYGWDAIDPLLWPETTHLFEIATYQQTVQLLDEFLATDGEMLIRDPLKRAMFQRDLWAVFDWLGLRTDNHTEQRQELQWRIARIMQKVALTQQEILLLPDNYMTAVKSGVFQATYQNENPNAPFLPTGLFARNGEWVTVGRQGGPIAMTHTTEFPFLGRSAFLVFIRVPGGREATLSFLWELNTEQSPGLPVGLEVALVRRGLLIDQQGNVIASPIVETIQLRHFRPQQSFYNFGLYRNRLFAEASGGLQPVDKEIMLFFSHGDVFSMDYFGEVAIDVCAGCHTDAGLGIMGIKSILSYSRARFPLPNGQRPILSVTTPEYEVEAVITWKTQQESWQRLQGLWNETISFSVPHP
ncbi:MAG TPA: hypothetical protein PLD25_26965 [Chloroflexota bacterium]|nr:hypothetical protein [Chloroflexota bacterium]HUM67246.1 hypothetical protein [Chloroflexota bacterium]